MSFVDVAKQFLSGTIEYAAPEVAQKRVDICVACPKYNKVLQICNVCKCVIPWKTKVATEKCPIGHW